MEEICKERDGALARIRNRRIDRKRANEMSENVSYTVKVMRRRRKRTIKKILKYGKKYIRMPIMVFQDRKRTTMSEQAIFKSICRQFMFYFWKVSLKIILSRILINFWQNA